MQPYLWSKPPEEDQGIPKQKMKNGPSFPSVAYYCSIWCVQIWRLPLEPPWLISWNCEISFSTMMKTQSFLSDSISDTHLLQTLLVFIQCIFVRFLLWALWDLPGGASTKEPTCHHGRCKRAGLIPALGRSPGEGIGYPLQYSWASLVAQMLKNLPAMWETWVWSLAWEDPLEECTATHSSILA